MNIGFELLMMSIIAVVLGLYLLYETFEAAIEDNRGRGVFRGLRYTVTATFAIWIIWGGIHGEVDWGHDLGAVALAFRFFHNLKIRYDLWHNHSLGS